MGVTGQNTSSAVMAQRHGHGADLLDLFPTPCWATRALCDWLAVQFGPLHHFSCWEPAAGLGDMVRPLREYFRDVYASDVAEYRGGHDVVDFLWPSYRRADFVVTNPPFKIAEQFIATALDRSSEGVAMLVRSAFLEGVGRHHRLFSRTPPMAVLQFTERVPMVKGRLDKEATTATSYCWIVWRKNVATHRTQLVWLAPCRKRLERAEDYPAREFPAARADDYDGGLNHDAAPDPAD